MDLILYVLKLHYLILVLTYFYICYFSLLFNILIKCNYDVIALSETWLNSSINDGELFQSDFTVYRCDRNSLSSVYLRFGGVLISVRRTHYPSEQILVPNSESLEIVFVKIKLCVYLFICCLYVPLQVTVLCMNDFHVS